MRRFWYTTLVRLANLLQRWFIRHPAAYRLLLAPGASRLRWRLGAWRAWSNYERAYRDVPAYRRFIDDHGGPVPLRYCDGAPDLRAIPEMDKHNYVERYSHDARCVGGRLPARGVVVDESSGSSGRPTSWVRGPEERWATKRMLQLSFRSAVGEGSFFVINAFSLGAWATGMNVSLSLCDVCILKSTGPDIDKIVHTLQEFGPGYDYVITGYPPFLKALADDQRLAWRDYRVHAIFGGEGLSESMRRYLLRSFTDVRGSYGASDLEINMAAETPFTIALRQELQANEALRERLLTTRHGVLPMVFQYNPLAYYLETNDAGELVVTLVRPTNIAPKVRYNIHDLGHVAQLRTVTSALTEFGRGDLTAACDPTDLPLLFLYGRSDASIDYFGANVTPDSVREILYDQDDLAPCLQSFRLISAEDDRHDVRMTVAVELAPGADPAGLDREGIAVRVFAALADANRDFANALHRTAPSDARPILSLHPSGTGPFADCDRIKHQYVASASTQPAPAAEPASQ